MDILGTLFRLIEVDDFDGVRKFYEGNRRKLNVDTEIAISSRLVSNADELAKALMPWNRLNIDKGLKGNVCRVEG